MPKGHRRPAWAEVNAGALERNARAMSSWVAPAELCAVVKADGYGHGALTAATAFLAGGARSLAVALVEEGIELRQAGIAAPILLLSEPSAGGMEDAVIHGLCPTIYTSDGLRAVERAAALLGNGRSAVRVHVKVDTGMHRVGAPPEAAVRLLDEVGESTVLEVGGIWTHLAVADEPDDDYTAGQLALFDQVLSTRGAYSQGASSPAKPIFHAANSAAALAFPASRFEMVRCGIALYGYSPIDAVPAGLPAPLPRFEPALSLKGRISYVKELGPGERISYGLAYRVKEATSIATVPLGYADGIPRRFGNSGGHAIVGGRRCRVAGNVTMDQLMLDCGQSAVAAGDEVVLLGRQGAEVITAEDWAEWLGVIPYEVLCGIGPRVPRVVV